MEMKNIYQALTEMMVYNDQCSKVENDFLNKINSVNKDIINEEYKKPDKLDTNDMLTKSEYFIKDKRYASHLKLLASIADPLIFESCMISQNSEKVYHYSSEIDQVLQGEKTKINSIKERIELLIKKFKIHRIVKLILLLLSILICTIGIILAFSSLGIYLADDMDLIEREISRKINDDKLILVNIIGIGQILLGLVFCLVYAIINSKGSPKIRSKFRPLEDELIESYNVFRRRVQSEVIDADFYKKKQAKLDKLHELKDQIISEKDRQLDYLKLVRDSSTYQLPDSIKGLYNNLSQYGKKEFIVLGLNAKSIEDFTNIYMGCKNLENQESIKIEQFHQTRIAEEAKEDARRAAQKASEDRQKTKELLIGVQQATIEQTKAINENNRAMQELQQKTTDAINQSTKSQEKIAKEASRQNEKIAKELELNNEYNRTDYIRNQK